MHVRFLTNFNFTGLICIVNLGFHESEVSTYINVYKSINGIYVYNLIKCILSEAVIKVGTLNKAVARIFGRGSAIWSEATDSATCFASEAVRSLGGRGPPENVHDLM